MSEIPQSQERIDAHTELDSQLTIALELEKLLSDINAISAKTGDMRFASEESADEASKIFVEKVAERLNMLNGVSSLDLTLRGQGVFIPDVMVSSVEQTEPSEGVSLENTKGAYVSLSQESPLRQLLPFESVVARINAAVCTGSKDDEGFFKMRGGLVVDLEKTDRHQTAIPIGNTEIPIVVTTVFKRGIVYFGNDTEIEINVLRDARAKEAWKDQFHHSGLSNGPFKKYLDKLDTALRAEDANEFIEMRDKKIIRTLGYYGAQYSRRGGKYADIASESILRGFGQGRPLQIHYLEPIGEYGAEERSAEGRLFQVLMPTGPSDNTEPAFVLEHTTINVDPAPITVVPIDRVSSLKF